MKKIYLISKRIFQIFLYLLETLGIALFLTLLINQYIPAKNFFENIERITVFYALYQLIIYNILQQLNDIKKDEYLALLNMYKYIDIYNSYKDENFKKIMYNLIEKQLDCGMLNDIDIRNEYKEIKTVLDNNKSFNVIVIKIKITRYENCYEEASLNWKYSILLRIFK